VRHRPHNAATRSPSDCFRDPRKSHARRAERALVLGGAPNDNGSQVTWGFYLHQTAGGGTRLIERGRHAVGKGILARLGFGPYLLDPVGFVMSRRMLKTIKRLAEAAPWKPQFVST
jgi:hypothetical protein